MVAVALQPLTNVQVNGSLSVSSVSLTLSSQFVVTENALLTNVSLTLSPNSAAFISGTMGFLLSLSSCHTFAKVT